MGGNVLIIFLFHFLLSSFSQNLLGSQPCYIHKPIPVKLHISGTSIVSVMVVIGAVFAGLSIVFPLAYFGLFYKKMYKKKE
jgi:hypothetical protein